MRNHSRAPASRDGRPDTRQTINRALNDFLRLHAIDRALLKRHQKALRHEGERFANLFYDYLLAFPATAAVLKQFKKRGGKIEDLVQRQVQHLFMLLTGDTSEASAQRMAEVGRAHHRHGIEPVWLLGAYLLYLDHLQTLIRTSPRIEDASRRALERDVIKLLFRDMGLALEGYWNASLHELTQEKTKVSELQARITGLLANIPQLLWSVDVASGKALYVSPSAPEICGGRASLPIPCMAKTVPEDRKKLRRAWQQALAGERVEIESRTRRGNGEVRWFRRIFCPFTDAAGKVVRVDGLMEDTTDARRMVQRLHALATTDPLTGLPNRTLFHDRFRQAINAATRGNRQIALLLLDIDHFKDINDTLGHAAGDQVLVLLAQRLSAVLRHSDTLARLGGDEFAILLPDVQDGRRAAARFIKKVMECFNAPLQLGSNELFLRAGVGIAVYPTHGEDAATLMSRADVAMYATKNRDIDYLYYDAALDPNIPQRLRLSGELRHAIDRGELALYYQPIADFRTRHIAAAEALLRWNHPRLGLLTPDKFIGLAERTGFIRTITYWVIETALRQCKRWRAAGLALRVAVNVSGRALRDPDFFRRIRQILTDTGAPASFLDIEITENTLMGDVDNVHRLLARLADLGIRLAIDDFGSGYSSLVLLKNLPVHMLKIDKSFVRNMARSDDDAAIVRSTVELGHNLGLRVVGEGIENRATWDLLAALGCDDAQGFYLDPPLPHECLTGRLKASSWPAFAAVDPNAAARTPRPTPPARSAHR